MESMKRQDILKMYKDGAITVDEALYLLSDTKDTPVKEQINKRKIYEEIKSSLIADIIEDTDFDDIKKAMDARDWSYSYSNGEVTIEELTNLATKLLGEAIDTILSKKDNSDKELYWGVSTGGFRAEAWYNEEEDSIEARLSFALCETESGIGFSCFI
jgi:hypothetical protein